jgi:hypothetical protein
MRGKPAFPKALAFCPSQFPTCIFVAQRMVGKSRDAEHLVWKATVDLASLGMSPEEAIRTIEELRRLLKELS